MTLFKKLRGDERGMSIVELALVAPILSTMVVGMIDISNAYSKKLLLEQSAQRAIEKVMESNTVTTTLYDALVAEASSSAGVPAANVTVSYWLECNGVKKTSPSVVAAYATECNTGETFARYLTVKIKGVYTPYMHAPYMAASYTVYGESGIRTQ